MSRRALLHSLVVLAAFGVFATLSASAAKDLAAPTLIRMHVVPSSDHHTDQELKLRVRDDLLEYLARTPLANPSLTFEEAVVFVEGRLAEIGAVAQRSVEANGREDDVAVRFGIASYGEREYAGVVVPAGEYLSLEIILGRGEGTNFWCILFPSMCFVPDEIEILTEERARGNVAEAAAPDDRRTEQVASTFQFRWFIWDRLFAGQQAPVENATVSLHSSKPEEPSLQP